MKTSENKKKYCAFGAMRPWRFGEVIETNERYTVIKPDFHGPNEYWETSYVKIFDTAKKARNETKKWIYERDEY